MLGMCDADGLKVSQRHSAREIIQLVTLNPATEDRVATF